MTRSAQAKARAIMSTFLGPRLRSFVSSNCTCYSVVLRLHDLNWDFVMRVTTTRLGLRACIEVAIFSLNFEDKFRMIVSMTVSNFVKICQILTILH